MAAEVDGNPPSVAPSPVVSDESNHDPALSISSTISRPHMPSSGVEPMNVPAAAVGGSTATTLLPSVATAAMSSGFTAVTGLDVLSCRRPVKSMPQMASFHVVYPSTPGPMIGSTCAVRLGRFSVL